MDYIESMIHEFLISNSFFNFNVVDMIQTFNYYSVIIYYTREDLKDRSTLGIHTLCVL